MGAAFANKNKVINISALWKSNILRFICLLNQNYDYIINSFVMFKNTMPVSQNDPPAKNYINNLVVFLSSPTNSPTKLDYPKVWRFLLFHRPSPQYAFYPIRYCGISYMNLFFSKISNDNKALATYFKSFSKRFFKTLTTT